MAVDTLEEDSVTVEGHDSVLDAEVTESDALAGGFYGLAVVGQIHRQECREGIQPTRERYLQGVGGGCALDASSAAVPDQMTWVPSGRWPTGCTP